MNNNGQTLGLSLMAAIFMVLAGMLLLNFVIPEVDTVKAFLTCSDSGSISDGTKLFCLTTDIVVPYWIYLVFAIAIGAITARIIT